jgi:hypothetical protein
LRNGARALLSQAVAAEVAALLSCHADKLTDDGRQRLVRHGHLPEREIMTGIGPVAVRCPLYVRQDCCEPGPRYRECLKGVFIDTNAGGEHLLGRSAFQGQNAHDAHEHGR